MSEEVKTTIEEWKVELSRLLISFKDGRPDGKTGRYGNPKTIEKLFDQAITLTEERVRKEMVEDAEQVRKTIQSYVDHCDKVLSSKVETRWHKQSVYGRREGYKIVDEVIRDDFIAKYSPTTESEVSNVTTH